jgi:zinc/manganese transport system substrate-binding protein
MNLRALFATLLVLGTAQPALAKLDVVATLPDLGAIARSVGGDLVNVTTLVEPGQDPHYVDARPSLLLPLNRAKLLVVNGLDLEIGWLPPLLVSARNASIQNGAAGYFDASTVVDRLEVPAGKVDRAQGDIHPGGNPHFTLDPRAGRKVAVALGQRLGQLDPDNAAKYAANAQALAQQLDTLAQQQAARFRTLPAERRHVVPYHRSLPYLMDWLGLDAVVHVEPRPGIQPDPAHVASVLKLMKANGVRALLQEEYYPRNTSETLSRLAGAQLVILAGGTRPDQTYPEHLQDIAEKIHAAVSP